MAIQRKWSETCEPNRTEPNRTEPNRTEPNRTEPNRTEPNRTEPNRTEPNRTEPNSSSYHTSPGVSPEAGGAPPMISAAASRFSPRRAGRMALLTVVLAACAALPFPSTALAQTCTTSSTAVSGFTGDKTDLAADCTTLLGLKDTLIGTATLSPDWAATVDMNTWEGVRVSGTPPRVTRLRLNSNQLTGSIPAALGNLTALETLSLFSNQLTGSIPALSTLTALETLSLFSNQLTESIPALSALTALETLNLSDNQLSGTIPTLSTLTDLTLLHLQDNQLTGSIPALNTLTNLVELDLNGNQLTGTIPALSALTNLEWLSLNNNQLTGTIPALSTLTSLYTLNLFNNQLSGTIPALSNLTDLEVIQLDNNQLSSFPDLSGLPNLRFLQLSANQLSSFPALSNLPSFEELYLSANQLSSFPDLSGLTGLRYLYLSANQLEGAIPDLSALTDLVELRLNDNLLLTGAIPDLSALTNLEALYLNDSNLSGTIPDLSALTNLVELYLHANPLLTGPIPDLSDLTYLQYLWLYDTQWTGTIPQALQDNAGLDLRTNRRPIPPSVEPCTAQAGQAFTCTFAAFTDPDNDTLHYRGTALPEWLTLTVNTTEQTLSLTGTPPATLRSTEVAVAVLATDEDNPSDPPACDPNRDDIDATEVNPPPLCASLTVTISVTNEDEPGTVTLAGTPAQRGRPLTATLSDPNGGLSGETWQWMRSSDQNTWAHISGATAHQYTPQTADVGQYLRVTVTYTDGEGSGKRAEAVTGPVTNASVVTLHLSDDSISENGMESSTVTATLDMVSTAETTVTVSAPASAVTLSSNRTLTIAAGATTSTGAVTLTAKTNTVDAPDKIVQVSGTTTNSLVSGPAPVALTIEDDDDPPTVTLVLSPASIREDAKVSTVTAELSHPSSAETTVEVAASAVSPAVPGDFTPSTNTTLTIAAGATLSSGTAVTLTSVDNDTDASDKQVTVSGTASNTQGYTGPADVTLTLTDDDPAPTVTLTLSETQIDESGADNSATLTVTLSRPSSAATEVTVTADPEGAVTLSPNPLTIAAGQTAGTLTVTAVNNDIDGPARQPVTIAADADNTQGVTDPSSKTLTIVDDDEAEVRLHLSPPTISEAGTESSTVTATLDRPSSTQIVVTVATASAYTLSTNRRLTFAAEATASTGTVTLTAVDNEIDAADATVEVGGTATNSLTVHAAELTITDDDAAPTVELVLSPASIREDAKVSTVTAELSRPSSAETTVVVAASAVSPAVAGDFTLSTNRTLTIAAGATASSGTAVTVTSVENDTDAPDKQVTVSGTASNTQGYTGPDDATLLIEDDDAAPRLEELAWSDTPITEAGGQSTLTVTLSHPSSAAIVVTLTADPDAVTPSPAEVRIEAGQTTGTVTLTAKNNRIDGPETTAVTVTAAVATYLLGTIAPATAPPLTITDDDDPPEVTLRLSPPTISEAGTESSTVTATLDRPSSTQIVVTVATASAYTLSTNRRLTFAAEATASTGTVTLTAVDNEIDAADATVQVEGTASPSGLTVNAAELTITDDDTRGVTVTPPTLSIREGDTADYTVVLASEPTETVTVAVTVLGPAVDSVNPESLTFTPATWATAQPVTVTADDDTVQNTNRTQTGTLTHTVTTETGGDYAGETAASVVVTVTDDESPSTTVTLVVEPGAVREAGDRRVTVTGTLDGTEREGATVVSLTVRAGTATADDFAAVAPFDLTIPANAARGTQTFTLTAQADSIHEPDETVLVSGSTTVGLTVTEAELTIRDNTGPPEVRLEVAPESISEGATSQVTARLNHRSSEETEVEVSAVAVPPAVDAAFTLSGTVLTIPAGQTASSGSVMLTAVNNDADEADKQVTLSGSATNDLGVQAPAAVTVTLTDDDPPEVTGEIAPAYVEGDDINRHPVATYTATNPANVPLTWTLSGPDAAAFRYRERSAALPGDTGL